MDKNDKNKKRRGKRLIVFLLLLFFLLGILMGIIFLRCGNKTGQSSGVSPGISFNIDPNSKNAVTQNGISAEEQGIVIHGRETMFIPADSTEAEVDLYNPEENAGLYYLTFELRLYSGESDDYEILYRSGLIEPGKHIYSISLSHSLEKGEYNGAIHVQPYKIDKDKTPTNNADMKIKIVAE